MSFIPFVSAWFMGHQPITQPKTLLQVVNAKLRRKFAEQKFALTKLPTTQVLLSILFLDD
jgi:hypothetical protein